MPPGQGFHPGLSAGDLECQALLFPVLVSPPKDRLATVPSTYLSFRPPPSLSLLATLSSDGGMVTMALSRPLSSLIRGRLINRMCPWCLKR